MNLLEIIVMLSIVMWYIIDRIKPLWEGAKCGKYITMAVAAAMATLLCVGYRLDIVCAFGIVNEPGTIGVILTILLLMGGSSAVAELIERFKGIKKAGE
jgi:predicted tellurium resistance membrane protein TerC